MNKQRLIGIDVARAIAVIGMVIVNFKVVLGEQGEPWLMAIAGVFDGKAAATFVVLAGIGLALMTNSAIRADDREKFARNSKRIIKRAIFLFTVGLSYIVIWPADILHFYGVYMLIALLLIRQSNRVLLISVVGFILLFFFLAFLFDPEKGWNLETLDYLDFWTVEGFFRNLFFNGFHPVIPWTAFMLYGLWFGRQDLHNDAWLKRTCRYSLFVFTVTQVLSVFLRFSDETLNMFFTTMPMPPFPLYMINGLSIATFIISGCILIAKKHERNPLIDSLNKTGQLALTFYVAHVMIGVAIVEIFGFQPLGSYPLSFSFGYALVFSLLCILFARVWLSKKKSGPLEWLMRKVTD